MNLFRCLVLGLFVLLAVPAPAFDPDQYTRWELWHEWGPGAPPPDSRTVGVFKTLADCERGMFARAKKFMPDARHTGTTRGWFEFSGSQGNGAFRCMTSEEYKRK